MIQKYKNVSIIYGGSGKRYAEALREKISSISQNERYPIQATIINERILTRELLSDVMQLFKDSEFCVAFLTKEDRCFADNTEKKRLRQNVIFELGMALIELGRERCILLSDFNVKDPDFELPTDMNSLEVLQFDARKLDAVLDDVVDTILKLSRRTPDDSAETEKVPQYDYLFTRTKYWVDYENMFVDRPVELAAEGKDFFEDTLSYWLSACKTLPHYDEKCLFLIERMGFLPFFGKTAAAVQFMQNAEELIENYYPSDIEYYGSSELLDFVKNLVQCAIDYTILKTTEASIQGSIRQYRALLQNMLSESIPNDRPINPLISVFYYDYLGLIYFRIYRADNDQKSLKNAEAAFLKSLEFVSSVDLSMQVWSGFILYNLARVFSEGNNNADAEKYFSKAIRIRSRWLRASNFNITVRNAMSYEYFLAKIDYIDMRRKFDLLSPEEALVEYNYVETELNAYSDTDHELNQLVFIRQILNNRRPTL